MPYLAPASNAKVNSWWCLAANIIGLHNIA